MGCLTSIHHNESETIRPGDHVRARSVALALAIVAALYLAPLLLHTPLTDPDEGLHASIAQEMREHGELVVPRFLGRPFLDKPILYFWAQAASISAFGDSAAAVRLPGLLFAILGVATTGWLAALLFHRSVGWIAAVCYATLALPWALAQAPVHDIALVPLVNLALGAFWRADADGTPERWRWAYAGMAGLALGLSILAKGLAGVAIVGIAFGLYVLIARRVTHRTIARGAIGVIVAIGVATPWYLAMEARQPGYLQYYIVARHVLGFVADDQPHGGRPVWYYVPAVIGGSLPWMLYLGRHDDGAERGRRPRVLLWAWLIGAFVFLSLGQSKLTTYILPAFPSVAILGAHRWAAALSGHAPQHASIRTGAMAHAILFGIVTAALPWAGARVPGVQIGALGIGASSVLTAAWAWAWWRIRGGCRASYAWPRMAAGTAATYGLALLLVASPLAAAHSGRDLAAYLNDGAALPPTVYVAEERLGSVVFYLRPNLRQSLTPDRIRTIDAGALPELPLMKGDVIAVPKGEDEGILHQLAGRNVRREQAGRYLVFVAE